MRPLSGRVFICFSDIRFNFMSSCILFKSYSLLSFTLTVQVSETLHLNCPAIKKIRPFQIGFLNSFDFKFCS